MSVRKHSVSQEEVRVVVPRPSTINPILPPSVQFFRFTSVKTMASQLFPESRSTLLTIDLSLSFQDVGTRLKRKYVET